MRELVIGEAAHDPMEDHELDRQVFHLRLANSRHERESASLLLKKMYGWRGYDVDPHAVHSPNRITLYAETGGATVGTMSLCLDDPVLGLPADENFRHELDQLRAQGRRLCEPSRLAIDKGASRRVFAGLIHISYLYAHHIHGHSDYVIEVNPRHVMFYRRMLGFGHCGTQRNCSRVGAPAVLLRLDLQYMKEQIQRYGGLMEKHPNVRSFYPFFFPPDDEAGITGRLMRGRG
ncbi:long-chain N-acyl amino acid synthase [Duganella ginsengisoli]|uniref:Long-chain N-acyl amino acid synthase n=2 Tax=Pseudoduganella ginsengisoli TaxID=1462440 RepID=A0A6L6Q421_9BURK|nr:long-chain N-acyl amino acid synthase [Pseudoduganella ginsengisoli]MTW04226.1 long-chain N-acyl amino acid synthase [Pseudoduganella ginsengisoli]